MKPYCKRSVTAIFAMIITLIAASLLPFFTEAEAAVLPEPKEYRAFWFSYYNYSNYRQKNKIRNEETFRQYFNDVITKGKSLGMNTIIVQVRPFGDALYKSAYYPWSDLISGKQGTDPGFDPLAVMTKAAHDQGLRIEAWINPYRVSGSTSFSRLSADNPARKWHSSTATRRYVLPYLGKIYYNPSIPEVRQLIVNGAVEIVKNYDVDGIHMDDYFYPPFSAGNVTEAFDGPEYARSPYKKMKKSIVNYRRDQVNILVKQLRNAIRAADPKATFGISPAGDPQELYSKYAHYVDFNTWIQSGYIDYICPQIYWGFNHSNCAYDKITDAWVKAVSGSKVKLYLGIAVYKAGHSVGSNGKERKEWLRDAEVLKKQIIYGRNKNVQGFAFFDYSDLISKESASAVNNLKLVLAR